jgi:uncharacterized glyoxalase superfamily protein PhnB
MIRNSTEEQRVTDTTLQGSLSLSLTANDLQSSLQFYQGLGFIIHQRYETDGKLEGVMLKAGNASLGVSQDDFAKGRDRLKGVGMSFYVETDQDIAALAARAKQAGVKLERDAAPLPWGPIGFTATDPDGFKVTILNRS